MSPVLTERFRLATSGARAVESFDLDGFSYLAIPQLALDAPGTPAGMNGGDSDTDLLLLRREDVGDGEYAEYQRIPAPGGEDAEFFTIKGRAYLAVASIRSGHGPYEYETDSFVHRWNGEAFEPFQLFPGFAAKQWRHFVIGDRHFLALAQGVALPHLQERNRPSVIFEWSGGRFVPFQEIPSAWAYNWHHFTAGGAHYLAHADHVRPAVLYRWDGEGFVRHQELVESGSRAFATFSASGQLFLACAVLDADSRLLRWEGDHFEPHQVLTGTGAREFAVVEHEGSTHLVRVNFIRGSREEPVTALESQVYRWDGDQLVEIGRFPTAGGTDVTVVERDGEQLLIVSNSLTPDARFRTDSCAYSW